MDALLKGDHSCLYTRMGGWSLRRRLLGEGACLYDKKLPVLLIAFEHNFAHPATKRSETPIQLGDDNMPDTESTRKTEFEEELSVISIKMGEYIVLLKLDERPCLSTQWTAKSWGRVVEALHMWGYGWLDADHRWWRSNVSIANRRPVTAYSDNPWCSLEYPEEYCGAPCRRQDSAGGGSRPHGCLDLFSLRLWSCTFSSSVSVLWYSMTYVCKRTKMVLGDVSRAYTQRASLCPYLSHTQHTCFLTLSFLAPSLVLLLALSFFCSSLV